MSVKRLAIPLCAVVSLLALAGVLQVVVLLFSSGSVAVAAQDIDSPDAKPIVPHVASAVAAEQSAEKARRDDVAAAVRKLVDPAFIKVDGALLDHAGAEAIMGKSGAYAGQVRYLDQQSVLASGCELVALAVAMDAEGFAAAPGDFVRYLRIGSNAATDYMGDPYRDGGGLAPAIVDAANAWAADRGVQAHALDMTGTTFDGLTALVSLGYPVIAWTTEGLVEPVMNKKSQDGQGWYSPEHCVVVYGVEGDDVLVSDSLEGLVRRSSSQFSHIYEACGNKAALVLP